RLLAMYQEHRPGELLREHVECYWTVSSPKPGRTQRVLPDGCMDIIFDLPQALATIVGTMTRPLVTTASRDLLGVRFRPGVAPALLRQRASDSTDKSLDLRDAWGRSALETAERVSSARSHGDRIALVEREILHRLAAVDQGQAVARGALELLVRSRG